MAGGNVTQKDTVRAQTAGASTKEFNALQDWMSSLGEPAASLIVSLVLAAIITAVAITMKIVF